MPFVADENVPQAIIDRLMADGFTVHSIIEASAGIPDEEVMRAAQQREFVLITSDRDFGELAIRNGLPVTGVILLELEKLSLQEQVARCSDCFALGEAHWTGHFSVMEPARIKRRPLHGALGPIIK